MPPAESAPQVRDSTPALCLPDVMDVAWSPHDAWLASCSVDNTVVIWNAVKFPGLGSWLGGGRNGLLIVRAVCRLEQGGSVFWLVAACVLP